MIDPKMSRRPHDLPWLLTMAVLCLRLPTSTASSGCIFLRDDMSVRCQNVSLLDIAESLHVLTTVVQNRPRTIDIEDCSGTDELPPLFGEASGRSPSSDIETLRVRRSGLRRLHPAALRPLSIGLRHLDLSHNRLRAVPPGLAAMVALRRLQLQHNRIVTLTAMPPALRHLDVAHNRLGLMPPEEGEEDMEVGERHGYRLKASLGPEDFSLGGTTLSLEWLSLRDNRLAAIPRHLAEVALPELRHLDLAENVIGQTDGLTTARLPQLQHLDLQSNRIQSANLNGLSATLKYLDLTENPYNCDCTAVWLYDWHASNKSHIRLPTCSTPERYRGRELNRVPFTNRCPRSNSSLPAATKGLRDYDVVRLATTFDSITIAWRVPKEDPSVDRQWAVVYRKATDSPHQMTLVTPRREDQSTPHSVWSQTISQLHEFTGYIVCVAMVQAGKYTIEPSKCRQATTQNRRTDGVWSPGQHQQNETGAADIGTWLEDITVSASTITIKWRLSVGGEGMADGQSLRHEWTIRIRRTGSDNYTDIPVYDITSPGETNGQMYEYGISDLAARTHYDVCLVDVEHRPISDRMTAEPVTPSVPLKVNQGPTCTTVQTNSNHILYATEIAAIALACAIGFIVSAVTLFLCRQKKLLRWKPKRLKKWFAVSCKERPISSASSSRFATATIPRLRCETNDRHSDRCIVGTWNTLRMPYKDFPQLDDSDDGPVKTYKDALTSVTIYKSGHSEC